jgi:hypothetical protein
MRSKFEDTRRKAYTTQGATEGAPGPSRAGK